MARWMPNCTRFRICGTVTSTLFCPRPHPHQSFFDRRHISFFPTQFWPAASTIVLLETLIYKKQDLLKTASVKHDDNGWFLKGSVSWEDKWKRRRRILNVLWSTVAYAFTSVGCKVDRQKFFKFNRFQKHTQQFVSCQQHKKRQYSWKYFASFVLGRGDLRNWLVTLRTYLARLLSYSAGTPDLFCAEAVRLLSQ